MTNHNTRVLQPGSVRELLVVAVPMMLSAGSLSIMNVIDRILLTEYSTDALAAALPAGVLHWTVMSLSIGIVMYVNTFVAQYEGAGQPERVVASVWQGFYLALICGVLLSAFSFLSEPIFNYIGHPPEVRHFEIEYFSVLAMGSIAFMTTSALSSYFSGRRRTMVVLWVNVLSVIVNIILDYVLIFGVGPFPQMGVSGAALGTVISRAIASLCFAIVMWKECHTTAFDFRKQFQFDAPLFKRLLRFGVPSGIHFFVDIAGFSVFVFVIGSLGARELAATSLAFNLNTLAFVPLIGIGIAVMTLVGNRVGEGRPELAVKTTWTAFTLSAIWMIGFAVVYLFFPDFILAPYKTSGNASAEEFAAIRETVIVLLQFVSAYCFFDAMLVIFSNAVRGAGDTRFPMLITFVCCWFIMVLPTWFYTNSIDDLTDKAARTKALWFGWSACTAYISLSGIAIMLRFIGGKWKSMKVIEESIIAEDTVPDALTMAEETGSAMASASTVD